MCRNEFDANLALATATRAVPRTVRRVPVVRSNIAGAVKVGLVGWVITMCVVVAFI